MVSSIQGQESRIQRWKVIEACLGSTSTQPIPIPPNSWRQNYSTSDGYSSSGHSTIVGRQSSYASGMSPLPQSGISLYRGDKRLLIGHRIQCRQFFGLLPTCTCGTIELKRQRQHWLRLYRTFYGRFARYTSVQHWVFQSFPRVRGFQTRVLEPRRRFSISKKLYQCSIRFFPWRPMEKLCWLT